MSDKDEVIEKLKKLEVDEEGRLIRSNSFLHRIKSFFKPKPKPQPKTLSLEEIEEIVQSRMLEYKKSIEKEKKKEQPIDLANIIKYIDKVAKQKYGVQGTHMIQKTAWHFLLTHNALPTDSIIDRGERIVSRIYNITDKIDKIAGSGKSFSDLEALSKDIDTVVKFKQTLQKLEPEKTFSIDDISKIIETSSELLETLKSKSKAKEAVIEVEQYPASSEEYAE